MRNRIALAFLSEPTVGLRAAHTGLPITGHVVQSQDRFPSCAAANRRHFITPSRIVLVIAAACLSACTGERSPAAEESSTTESDRKAIEALREQELTAFNSGDVQGFIDIVTEDVVFDSPNRPVAVGKDAIRSLCETVFERFTYDATYPTDELVVDRNWAFDRGIWIENRTPKAGGEQTQISFGILQIYRRQTDGSWKLARSIWNTK